MIRAPMGNRSYWERAVANGWRSIEMAEEQLKVPPVVSQYEAQYVWNYTLDHPRQTLTQYARGDAIRDLYNPFPKVLDAWELSNREAEAICQREGLKTCRAWTFDLRNLQYYQWCLWLVSLGLLFEIDEAQWQRLLVLVGGEGEDAVLDGLIATRTPGRKQAAKVLHRKPYGRLWKTIKAPAAEQPGLLRAFVEHWYAELKRDDDTAIWWYDYGDPEVNPLDKGSYFGRWCVEAAATAKVLGIDDGQCLGHEHYPGDLLRPDGPGTHLDRSRRGRWRRALRDAGTWRGLGRNALAILAFLVVWATFPSDLLREAGLDAMWVGMAKMLAALGAAWLVSGYRRAAKVGGRRSRTVS